jgi:DNA-binding MarR family transcriptional regulator
LVHRLADKNDHRRSLVEITSKGNDLLAELVPIHLAEVRTGDGELLRSLQQLIGIKTLSSKRGAER